MTCRLTKAYVGHSVSHGTLCEEDLVESFVAFVSRALPGTPEARRAVALREEYVRDTERARYVLEDLFDLLDECAPNGTYFGAHEGDGSDFGFWPVVTW